MKKKIIILITIISLFLVFMIKFPVQVDKQYEGFIISYKDDSINQNTKIVLKGELSKNIFLQNKFDGHVIIGDTKMSIQSTKPSNIKGVLKDFINNVTNNPLMVQGSLISEEGYLETSGVIYMSNDLEELWGFSKSIREKYNMNDVLVVAPANSIYDAKNIFRKKEGNIDIDSLSWNDRQ